MSTKNTSTAEKTHKNKHNTVLGYIRTPLLYVVISLVLVIPLCLGMLHVAVNTVHRIQPYFRMSISDITLNDDAFTPSDVAGGTVVLPPFRVGDKIAELRCDAIGLETPVYCGSNHISRRTGVGMSVNHCFPGQGKEVLISGNAYGVFRGVENLAENDELVLTTNWGVYRYVVTGKVTAKEVPEADTFETLIVSVPVSKDAFASLSDARLYVMAEIASGPSVEEVQS